MSRIITNVDSLLSQRVLANNNKSLTTSLERLSTGFRINRGKDDPAGLIASENLRAEKASISAAIGNAERADQVINIAEGGLTEISSMLVEIESLVVRTANEAGLSQEEREANQLQIDNLLQAIDRIANQTSFQGTKLLNGTFSYITSGIAQTELSDVRIDKAKLPSSGNFDVNLQVLASAQVGRTFLSAGGGAGNDTIASATISIEVAGGIGVQRFTFGSGTTTANIVSAVNQFKEATGVSAAVINASTVVFQSTQFGSRQFTSVSVIESTGVTDYTVAAHALEDKTDAGQRSAKDFGRDAEITVNGIRAQVDGLEARASSSGLDVTIRIANAFNVDLNASQFTITGGGANFMPSPNVDLAGQIEVGIDAVTAGRLGTVTNGRLFQLGGGNTANVVTGDLNQAQRILSDSIKQINTLRGRLGSIQKDILAPAIRSLGIAFENTAAAESQIRDTDFAAETANLTRNQILVNAATQTLSIANVRPQSVLQLLQ